MAGVRITRRKNPHHDELPYDEWLPVHAVRFNTDGTVSLMTEESDGHGIENIQGFMRGGKFHPIRWDPYYDRTEVDEAKDYVISPSREFYRRTGETPPRGYRFKRKRR